MTLTSDIREMVAAGYGREDVIARFGATPAVCVAYKRIRANPVARAYGAAGTTRERAQREAVRSDLAMGKAAHAAAVAGILHLVDLKRAGHSPRFTEHHIPPDREQFTHITRPLLPFSYEGSHFE